jgi:thymidylate synthase (FAD)
MFRTEPKAYIIAETCLNPIEVSSYLQAVVRDSTRNIKDESERVRVAAEAEEFAVKEVRANVEEGSGGEALVALMGRMCYRSFAPGLNPNVSRTRTGLAKYLGHIFESGHGSVLEHMNITVVFHNVSRVFTHELVRHRAGCAMSQESLRFVRLDDLGLWLPPEIEQDPELVSLFEKTFENLEQLQVELAKKTNIDTIKDFDKKKRLTSAFRRIAPDGLATTIGFTANARAWRHILAMRGAAGAEAEMRCVMFPLAKQMYTRYPSMFSDMKLVMTDCDSGGWEGKPTDLAPGEPWDRYEIEFENKKV